MRIAYLLQWQIKVDIGSFYKTCNSTHSDCSTVPGDNPRYKIQLQYYILHYILKPPPSNFVANMDDLRGVPGSSATKRFKWPPVGQYCYICEEK